MRKHYKSRFPAANVSRFIEVVATDTYFSDTPALDVGLLGHGGTIIGETLLLMSKPYHCCLSNAASR
jgi:hypothetical protein